MSVAPASTDRRRWFGLVAIALATSLVIIDITIVNVAIPAIITDLGATATQAQWIQEAYTLVFAALLLTSGRIGDRIGRRRMLVLGIGVFVGASVLAALAPSAELLIAARVLQGVGCSAIFPATLSLINATFTGRERGIAFAVWGSTIGGMAAVGPLLGGWLTTEASWRWAFGINVPLGALVVVGMLAFVVESRDPDTRPGTDVVGALLSAAAAASLVFALIEGRTLGWWAGRERDVLGLEWPGPLSPVPYLLLLFAVLVGAFVVHQRRRAAAGRVTVLDLSLFAIPSFRRGNVAALTVSLGQFGILFALPLWLQNALGYTALETGVALLPLSAAAFLAGGVGGVLTDRFGAARTVQLGLACEVVGVAWLASVIATDTPWWATIPALAVYGFGVGLATAQLGNVVLADVPPAASGQAAGTETTAQELGSALGIAVLGSVLFTELGRSLTERLGGAPGTVGLVDAVRESAGGGITGLAADPATAAVADAARAALTDGARTAAWTAAAFLVLGLAASLRLRSTPAPPAPHAPGPTSGTLVA
jgi:EmrB/QacA subfamily drug resistance transporter